MYSVSFDLSERAPLDFNTDPAHDAIADASDIGGAAIDSVTAPDAQALLERIGVPAHRARQVLAESLAPDA